MKSRLQGLYVLTDQTLTSADRINDCVQQAINGGCKIVQYRDKTSTETERLQQATKLNDLCRQHDVLFIINDDISLAKQSGAHGVHLGKNDPDLSQARSILGADSIIGVSCYNDLQRAKKAQENGADYIAFGSFFQSNIKPDAQQADIQLLTEANPCINIPIVAIGGITRNNAGSLINAGADMVAVISDVFAQNDITSAASDFSRLFNK